MQFAELCAKTNFSFLEGGSHPEEMVATAAALGYRALAITDTSGVYAIPRAHSAAKQAQLPLIIGAEFSGPLEITLLAMNRKGYANLCELLTQYHSQTPPKEPWDSLLEKHRDLLLLLPDHTDAHTLAIAKDCFGDRLYLKARRFLDGKEPSLPPKEIPCIATNAPLFHTPKRKPLHDVLTAIRHRTTLRDAGFKLTSNAERFLKPIPLLTTLFADKPEWLAHTVEVAERCHFSLDTLHYSYPTEWVPENHTSQSYLETLVWAGARERYAHDISQSVTQQLSRELRLIEELQYTDYFLTAWDIVRFAQSNNILYQGRGSAANSMVCYVLGITAVDPIRMDLLFERFLSRERQEPPDIDIDFEHERREEVIQYLYQRYGRDRAAITGTFITYRRRSAMREVAKVFEIPETSVKKLLTLTAKRKLSEVTVEEMMATAPELSPHLVRLYNSLVLQLLSFPRHLGTHVGGFVLCQEKLTRNIPVEPAAMPGRTIIQWDKNDLDQLGFVRVDVLGLGILTCLRKSFEYLKEVYQRSLTLATIPSEDPAIYQMLQRADTVGVFQVESRAQMNMLPRLRPFNFFDLVVEIALVRPGPIQGEMVHPYLRRRWGKEQISYPHPALKAILEKTYGVPIFQEQIMKIAMQVAGFSGGEADELRRAMGSWRREGPNRLSRLGEKFRAGLIKKGIEESFATRIFSQIEGFAEYGFPESHAASFALIAYASAYLKHYYPDVFLCALLNSQPMGFYSTHTLIYDAIRHGVQILPVAIGLSRWENSLEKPSCVRLGFREIFGLSKTTGRVLEGLTPAESFLHFIDSLKERLHPKPLTKRELFFLASADAFKTLGLNRRQAFWEIQACDLGDSKHITYETHPQPLPKETPWETLSEDYRSTGVSLFAHPISYLRKPLEGLGAISSRQLSHFKNRTLKVGGIVLSRQMPPSASGVLFITLEDEFGFTNLVIWNPIYQKYRELLLTQSFLICQGKVQKAEEAEVYHLIVEEVRPLLQETLAHLPSYDFH